MRRTLAGAAWLATLMPFAAVAGPNASLVDAVRGGDLKEVRAMLARRADVNVPAADGSTALHWAVYKNDAALVDLLLGAGANPNTANRYGVPPLVVSATNGNADIADRLLRAGADARVATAGGETVLMTAARSGNTELVQRLLARGADPNARETARGQTALMWAAGEGHASVIRALITAGADLRATSHPPSAVAVTEGQVTEGGRTLRSVKRIDAFTPLMFAARAGHIDAVGALLDSGAGSNDTLPDGTSLLTLAAMNAHYELISYLLDRGADPNAAKQGWTALHQIVRTRTLNVGWIPHPVPTGRLTSLDAARRLLARGADVNARMTKRMSDGFRSSFSFIGATPYLLAVKGADLEMARLLIEQGADSRAVMSSGTTALMLAAGVELFNQNEDGGTNEEAFELTKYVFGLGADVNAINKAGETALHGAAHRGSKEIVQLLVDQGARLDVVSKEGFTALMIANGEASLGGTLFLRRPEVLAQLRQMMLDRGLVPEVHDVDTQPPVPPRPRRER